MKVILRVFSYMRKMWLAEIAAYVSMLAINGIRLLTPQLYRRIVDVGIAQGRTDILAQSVLLLLGITALQGVFRFGESYLSEYVSQNVAYEIRNQVYEKLQSLSFSYHDRQQTGQLLSRTTSDVERLQRITGRGILRLVDAIVLLIGTMIVIVRMNLPLSVLGLSLMPVITLFMRNYIEKMHPMFHARQDQMADLTARLEQNLRGMAVVRGFAQEPAEVARFDADNTTVYNTSMTVARAGAFAWPFILFLASIGSVLVLGVGGWLVTRNMLTLGALVAFNSYMLQLINPVRRMGTIFNMLGESQASAERVFEILDARSEVENAPDAKELGDIQGAVTFDQVSFGYLGTSQVLSDLSFHIEPGQVVALLGPTGSGKSTIVNLIPRFYDVTGGAIRIDGEDIRSVTIESLREQIGMVLQETMLFGSTIRENITFGKPNATQEEIETAAKAAAAHDFIMSMPQGYDTEVGERGVTLSGGQRQRVAIARALLLNPRILILDDATSSVDTDTEQQIQSALNTLMQNRTSFVIAQRVSTVRNADLILVIDQGELVAQGKHHDLIRESGIYAEIYHRQLGPENAQLQHIALEGKAE